MFAWMKWKQINEGVCIKQRIISKYISVIHPFLT